MARRLRIEFEGAIYHVMARGNARQKIFRDDADRRRLTEGLEHTVIRCGWELLCYVIMGNHMHLLLQTPRPNLAAGMQGLLSGYAIWWGRRHRRQGHLFQGRYRAKMIENESYYWTVSRYVHLNPVRAGLVARPEQWEWSSYPGYRDPRRRQAWVAYDRLLAAWQGDHGKSVATAYVRFVEAGLSTPPASPFREAFGGWILGSERFLDQLRSRVGLVSTNPPLPEARQLAGLDPDRIMAAVAGFYGVDATLLSRRHDPHLARAVAAWLCRRHTTAPLRLLAERLGLSRADSVPNLTRRLEARLQASPSLAEELDAIMRQVRVATAGPPLPPSEPSTDDQDSSGVRRPTRRTKNKA
jgi:putative transposase